MLNLCGGAMVGVADRGTRPDLVTRMRVAAYEGRSQTFGDVHSPNS
jgi:hypothetical protein